MSNVLFLLGIEDSNLVYMRGISQRGSTYELQGSIDLYQDLRHPELKKQVVVLGGADAALPEIKQPDIIFNCITDADSSTKALRLAMEVIRKFPGVPVINRPVNVLKTRRDDVATALAGIPGLVVPAVQRITPRSHREILDAIVAGPGYPAIVRHIGMHGGKGMLLLESAADAPLLEQIACDGSEYYLAPFVDFRDDDGYYRKLRLVFVGNRVFARHLLVSTHWNVHASVRLDLMTEKPALQEAEKDFLINFGKTTFPPLAERLGAMSKALKLDYFSVDCSLRPNGDLLIFEANASGNALRQALIQKFPYLRPVVQRLRGAVVELLGGAKA